MSGIFDTIMSWLPETDATLELKKQNESLKKERDSALSSAKELESHLAALKSRIETEVTARTETQQKILKDEIHKLKLLETAYTERFGEAEVRKVKKKIWSEGGGICPRCRGEGGYMDSCPVCNGTGWTQPRVINEQLVETVVFK
jgi:hypothetical protein